MAAKGRATVDTVMVLRHMDHGSGGKECARRRRNKRRGKEDRQTRRGTGGSGSGGGASQRGQRAITISLHVKSGQVQRRIAIIVVDTSSGSRGGR